MHFAVVYLHNSYMASHVDCRLPFNINTSKFRERLEDGRKVFARRKVLDRPGETTTPTWTVSSSSSLQSSFSHLTLSIGDTFASGTNGATHFSNETVFTYSSSPRMSVFTV